MVRRRHGSLRLKGVKESVWNIPLRSRAACPIIDNANVRKGRVIATTLLDRPQQVPFEIPKHYTGETLAPGFRDRLRQQAEAIRRGEVGVHNFAAFWDIASQLSFDHYEGAFKDPDGNPLTGYDVEDAHLLKICRSRDVWQVNEDDAQDIELVRRSFAGLTDELDPRIPVEIAPGGERQMVVGEVAAARTWLGERLGIKNPSGFLLDELAQKAAARLELSTAINAGLFDDLFDGFPKQRAEQAMDGAGAQAAAPGEPAPALGPDNGYVTLERPMLAGSDWQGSGGWREVEVLPWPEGHVVRSHRRKNHYLARVRRLAAAAALAVGAWIFGTPDPADTARVEPTPEVVFHQPPVIGEPATAEFPPTPEPPPPPQPEPDRILTPGAAYDPVARSGAIIFMVEKDAMNLGCSRPTLTQSYELTKRTLEYMGMSWSEARFITPDTELRFPPASTMRAWIAEVIGPDACPMP